MKLRYIITFAVVIIAAVVLAIFQPRTHSTTDVNTNRLTITNQADRAFGNLNVQPNTSATIPATTKVAPIADTNTGTNSGSAAGNSGTAGINYVQYTYAGTLPLPVNLPVMKRQSDPITTNMVGPLPGGLLLNTFSDLQTQSMTFAMATADGYTITIDAQHGTASMWRQVVATRTTGNVTPTNQPAIADDVVLKAAADFLKAHNISTDGYGPPAVIANNMFIEPEALKNTTSTAPVALPYAQHTVIYPWVINGTPVVDISGNPVGMHIIVDGSLTITNVDTITDLQFASSKYALVTEAQTVLEVAKRGGIYGSVPPVDATPSSVPLQTPTVVYMLSQYQLTDDGSELLVPAFKFPIQSTDPSQTLYQTAIIVPLLPELLAQSSPSILPADTGTSTSPAVTPSTPTP